MRAITLSLIAPTSSEIIADFSPPFNIEEEFLSLPIGTLIQHLHHVVFLREEPK